MVILTHSFGDSTGFFLGQGVRGKVTQCVISSGPGSKKRQTKGPGPHDLFNGTSPPMI